MFTVDINTKLKKLFKHRFHFDLIREWEDESIIDQDEFVVQTYEIIIKEKENKKISFSFFMKQLISFIKYLQSVHTVEDDGAHRSSKYINKMRSWYEIVPDTSINVNYAGGNFDVEYDRNIFNDDNDNFLKNYFPTIILDVAHFYNIGTKIGYSSYEEKEETCIMCRSNFPNVLFSRCMHNVECKECFNKLDINIDINNPVKCFKCGVEDLMIIFLK